MLINTGDLGLSDLGHNEFLLLLVLHVLGHLDEHTVESLAQFVHLLIALLVVLVLHHFFKIYKRLLEGLAQLLVDTRIHLILDVRLLTLGLLLHLHALEVELLLLMTRPQIEHKQGNENI